MRFGVLGTGFWAKEVHAAALAAHPDAELVGVWGRDLAKAKAVGAEFDVAGLRRPRRAAGRRSTPCRSPLPPDVQAPLAERAAAAGKHLLLEKPIALDVAGADRVVTAVRDAGVASVVFFTFRFRRRRRPGWSRPPAPRWPAGTASWLALARPDSPFDASPWRKEHGALWDIGPHALSLLVPALGPVVSVQAGAGAAATPCTWS